VHIYIYKRHAHVYRKRSRTHNNNNIIVVNVAGMMGGGVWESGGNIRGKNPSSGRIGVCAYNNVWERCPGRRVGRRLVVCGAPSPPPPDAAGAPPGYRSDLYNTYAGWRVVAFVLPVHGSSAHIMCYRLAVYTVYMYNHIRGIHTRGPPFSPSRCPTEKKKITRPCATHNIIYLRAATLYLCDTHYIIIILYLFIVCVRRENADRLLGAAPDDDSHALSR